MISCDISAQHTFLPSESTPRLTVNKDAIVDLDSSNAFEGPEKLLEVWFAPGLYALPAGCHKDGLKSVAQKTWKEMLDLVNCKVLSVVESKHVDAYLLSESSMFVFAHKIILKTCGTTTLLLGLRRMLRIAAIHAGFPSQAIDPVDQVKTAATPYRVFYSRKNFLFPDKQRGPHRSWKEEVRYLDGMFACGSAYMVGKMNGDHWYLYLTTPNTMLTPPRTPEHQRHGTETKTMRMPASSGYGVGDCVHQNSDETLEILMTDLDVENAKQFYVDDALAVAEGQYAERARQARREAASSLGDLGIAITGMNGSTLTLPSTVEDFDVFSHTSADNGALTPDDEIDFVEELAAAEGHALGTVVSEACGLADVYPSSRYPDARIDAYLFTPCGFSANGVIPAPDQAGSSTHYFTVHVTPEAQCSFASFETNVPGLQSGRETVDIIEQVVNIFKPGRFSVTIFEAKANSAVLVNAAVAAVAAAEKESAESGLIRGARMDMIKGYRRIERIVHDLDGYDLVFRYYERDGWEGGAPRLGEVDT